MKRTGMTTLLVLSVMLLTTVTGLWARKEAQMPDNFGSAEWAASNWDEAVKYLKYLTRDDFREELLKVAPEERKSAWEKFWKSYDPARATEANEFLDRYFERVRYANENFASILKYGWETERGEAWIRLGPPRWQDRYNMRGPGRDIEVWEYWAPMEVDLVFVDRSGVGDFHLVNPQDMIDRAYLYGE